MQCGKCSPRWPALLVRNNAIRIASTKVREPRSQKIPSTRPWHSSNVLLPRPAGRSLAELGFLVPSKLPQGSLEPRDSAPSKRELQHGSRPVRFAALFTTKVVALAGSKRLSKRALRRRRSRPGHIHAGGPRSEGALGGAKH